MKSLQRMTQFLIPYRWVMIMGLFTVVLPVAMELVVPRMLQLVIDQGIRANNMDMIVRGSLTMLGAALIGAIATLGQGIFRAQLSQGIAFDLRNALFSHTQTLSFGNLDQIQTGSLMTRISSDVDVVRFFSSAGLALLLRAVLMITGSVVMIIVTDRQLALIVLIILPIAGAIIWFAMRIAQPLFVVVQERLAQLNTIVQENLAGVQVVKAYVRERFEIGRFEKQNINYRDQQIKVGRLLAVVLPVLAMITNVGTVAVLRWGGIDVIGGRLSVGELVAFNNYLMIGMSPLLLLSSVLTMVSRAEASAGRVLEVLDTGPLIKIAASPHDAAIVKGRVTFKDVVFHYNGPESEEVLNGVNFEVEPGRRVAILGATGSGKSTLMNLISRFYDATGGQVLIDGIDVRDWSPKALRSQIGIVLQETTLFSGTIRENIAYGRADAPIEDIIAAARAAQAHEFIMAGPDGYDSVVEARGANLSGGQRQRIAIARAILISPGILIMDDSTSAVDLTTEVQIQRALSALMAGRTTFIVAQRINSVLNADQIIVLDAGRITAQGTHRQLLQTSPVYQEIYQSQLGEADPAPAALSKQSLNPTSEMPL